jgi:uncharacterized damage-inducible protein DinB
MLSIDNALLEYQIKFWREKVKPTLDRALEIAPDDKLDWAPAGEMLTLGNVFLHISETSDWWYDEVIKGRKFQELVPSNKAPAPPKAEIARYMKIHWDRLDRFFAEDSQILNKSYQIQGREKPYHHHGNWVFTHLLEHDIHHRSQINQYLRILGITPPEI